MILFVSIRCISLPTARALEALHYVHVPSSALQQSHDLFVSGSPPIHRKWIKATTSNLKLSGHFLLKENCSILTIHQTCICSCSAFFHFQNEIISWTLISLCSSRFRQELSPKKKGVAKKNGLQLRHGVGA